MLAATEVGVFIWLIVFGIMMVASLLAKRGAKKLRDSLEVRDGRVVLKEERRLKLARNPQRLQKVEALIDKNYAVDERGEIVTRSDESEQPAPAARAPENEATEKDERFRSAWDEQDAGPSIWDEKDKAAFWGDDSGGKSSDLPPRD